MASYNPFSNPWDSLDQQINPDLTMSQADVAALVRRRLGLDGSREVPPDSIVDDQDFQHNREFARNMRNPIDEGSLLRNAAMGGIDPSGPFAGQSPEGVDPMVVGERYPVQSGVGLESVRMDPRGRVNFVEDGPVAAPVDVEDLARAKSRQAGREYLRENRGGPPGEIDRTRGVINLDPGGLTVAPALTTGDDAIRAQAIADREGVLVDRQGVVEDNARQDAEDRHLRIRASQNPSNMRFGGTTGSGGVGGSSAGASMVARGIAMGNPKLVAAGQRQMQLDNNANARRDGLESDRLNREQRAEEGRLNRLDGQEERAAAKEERDAIREESKARAGEKPSPALEAVDTLTRQGIPRVEAIEQVRREKQHTGWEDLPTAAQAGGVELLPGQVADENDTAPKAAADLIIGDMSADDVLNEDPDRSQLGTIRDGISAIKEYYTRTGKVGEWKKLERLLYATSLDASIHGDSTLEKVNRLRALFKIGDPIKRHWRDDPNEPLLENDTVF